MNTPLKSRQEPRLPNPELGFIRPGDPAILERDDFSSNRHPALSFFCLSMIFSENRYPLFPDHALAQLESGHMDYMCQVSSSELGLIDPCLDLCESLTAHASRRSRRSLLSMRLLCFNELDLIPA